MAKTELDCCDCPFCTTGIGKGCYAVALIETIAKRKEKECESADSTLRTPCKED